MLRACFVSDDAVIVADWLDGSSSWDLSVLLHPGVIVDDGPGADDRRGLRVGDDQLELVLPGTAVADRGAWADGYDQVTSAVRLSTRGASAGPVVWALAAGDLPDVSGEGAALIVDGTVVVVSFGDDGAMELALSR